MQQGVPSRVVVAGIAVVSAAALLAAFVAQYGFDLAPCELCLLQRLPYGAILVFGLLALMPAVDAPSRRQVVCLCAALFALDAGIAAYHAGGEYHWWPLPGSCTGSLRQFSLEDIARALTHAAPPPACDQPAVQVFGISMAGANAMAAAFFAVISAFAAARSDWSR